MGDTPMLQPPQLPGPYSGAIGGVGLGSAAPGASPFAPDMTAAFGHDMTGPLTIQRLMGALQGGWGIPGIVLCFRLWEH